MKLAPLVLAGLLFGAAAPAQEASPVDPETSPGTTPDGNEGLSLLEEGARMFLRGLIQEMEPALNDMAEGMEEFAGAVEPMLRDLARMMGDISNYNAPEMLPNGDIIIRRKTPLVPEEEPRGEIDI